MGKVLDWIWRIYRGRDREIQSGNKTIPWYDPEEFDEAGNFILSAGDEGRVPPHCDSSVLHGPSICPYCDHYPDLQQGRIIQRINFSEPSEQRDDFAPCPSTHWRTAEQINRWPGNRPEGYRDWLPLIPWEDVAN